MCGNIRTGSQTDVKLYGRTDSWTNVQMDRRADLSKSDTHEFHFKLVRKWESKKEYLVIWFIYKTDLMIKEN